MTPRRASVLAFGLPPGAGVWRAVGEDSAWTDETHLAAVIVDQLAAANWQRGGSGARPKPLPRPAEARAAADREARIFARAEDFQARHPTT